MLAMVPQRERRFYQTVKGKHVARVAAAPNAHSTLVSRFVLWAIEKSNSMSCVLQKESFCTFVFGGLLLHSAILKH